jgi:hypothetical protein
MKTLGFLLLNLPLALCIWVLNTPALIHAIDPNDYLDELLQRSENHPQYDADYKLAVKGVVHYARTVWNENSPRSASIEAFVNDYGGEALKFLELEKLKYEISVKECEFLGTLLIDIPEKKIEKVDNRPIFGVNQNLKDVSVEFASNPSFQAAITLKFDNLEKYAIFTISDPKFKFRKHVRIVEATLSEYVFKHNIYYNYPLEAHVALRRYWGKLENLEKS